MGKDKRKNLIVSVTGNSNKVAIEDASDEVGGNLKIIQTTNLPISAEEIILKLDMLNVKWKQITFSDFRCRRGIIFKKRLFSGDTIVLTKNDTRNSNTYHEKLNTINTKILRL